MGRIRKTARFVFSIGGYDGISPIAKESEGTKLLREQNELLEEQNRLLRPPAPLEPSPLAACPGCGARVKHAFSRVWERDGSAHECG